MRDLFAVQDDLVFAVDFFDGHVGQDVILRRLGKNLSGPRIELGDVVGAFLHLLDADAHSARDFGKAPFPEIRHVIGNDLVFEAASRFPSRFS